MKVDSANPAKVVVIGGGIGGLAAAILLAKSGRSVRLLEKNESLGGRARVFTSAGFRFDMGPSWYLMPDVFEHFFELVGRRITDYLTLHRLAPSYRIHLPGHSEPVDLTSDPTRDGGTLARFEADAPAKLDRYLKRIAHEYALSIKSFIYRNANHPLDMATWSTVRDGSRLPLLRSMHRHLGAYFHSGEVRRILEYQTLFLGSPPHRTPGIYGAMNHVDFAMGVFYPEGGIGAVVGALERLAVEFGVEIRTSAPVRTIETPIAGHRRQPTVRSVELESGERLECDMVVSNADIWFTETRLLEPSAQSYPEPWWEPKVTSPTAAILYLGVEGRCDGLVHHNLVFPSDWERSFADMFERPALPNEPSLYVCCPSRTDPTVAPEGCENLFVLQPLSPKLVVGEPEWARLREMLLGTLETRFGVTGIRERILTERRYHGPDFASDYNAFRGNALGGLAHTLSQTSVFRPRNVSPKVEGLYYVGAGTNPGIGMPMCLVSAELLLKAVSGDRSDGPLRAFPEG
ncbi:MAG: phytoene desaturase family protein [Armatimonadota bacterium]